MPVRRYAIIGGGDARSGKELGAMKGDAQKMDRV